MSGQGVSGRGRWRAFRTGLLVFLGLGALGLDCVAQPRIVGGVPAKEDAYPWMVTLLDSGFSDNTEAAFCGGVLIAERTVLTAAHCVFTAPDILAAADAEVLVGAHRLGDATERLSVERISVNPNFDPVSLSNDLAVLQLGASAAAEPLPIAESLPPPLSAVLALGWGSASEEGSIENVLRQVELQMLDAWTCQLALDAAGAGFADESMVCAGRAEGGADTCYGDSGGPLIWETDEGARLVGITSFGVGCGRVGRPGVYARVAAEPEAAAWLETCVAEPDACESLLQLNCVGGGVYALDQFCDGTSDCSDASDEAADMCPFSCGDGREVPPYYLCDYYNDCRDGEDESAESCGDWACLDGTSISRTRLCDGAPDCAGGRDEDAQLCAVDRGCDGGTLLRIGQVCDGRADCYDGDDERDCAPQVTVSAIDGEECGGEGKRIAQGSDLNRNGQLDAFEVQAQTDVCESKAPEPASLVRVDELEPGPDCLGGGLLVATGIDLDGDGVLSTQESEQATRHCAGGLDTQFTSETVPPGQECEAGGVRIMIGYADAGAAREVALLCHGASSGASGTPDAGDVAAAAGDAGPWLVSSARFPVHATCPGAGVVVSIGKDVDRDGRLSLQEVETESVLCDGKTQPRDSGCGCSLGGRPGRTGHWLMAVLLALGLCRLSAARRG